MTPVEKERKSYILASWKPENFMPQAAFPLVKLIANNWLTFVQIVLRCSLFKSSEKRTYNWFQSVGKATKDPMPR